MKVVLLTTKSRHHKYLTGEIFNKFNLVCIIQETKILKPNFETLHKFEIKREKFEKKNLDITKYHKISPHLLFKTKNINSSEVFKKLNQINPDIIITSGASILKNRIIKNFKNKIYNLHGGNMEKYRGLDSHLWAIYHNDFKSFDVTLHKLLKKVDTGSIISSRKIKISRSLKLFELRKQNIIIAEKLVSSFLRKRQNKVIIVEKKLKSFGRYYSFMPKDLKEVCYLKFNNYVKKKS